MITRAAIMYHGLLHVGVRDERHADIIRGIFRNPFDGKTPNINEMQEQGFVDEKGVFYDRVAAAQHALECGQITNDLGPLRSEDLW